MAKKKVKSYEEFQPELLYEYAGLDNIVTSNLFRELYPSAKRMPFYTLSKEGVAIETHAPTVLSEALAVKKPALNFMIDMEINGFLYDCQLNRRLDRQMRAKMEPLEDGIFSAIGRRINLDSATELSKLLYYEHKFPVQFYTKKKQPATSGDALKAMAEQTGLQWLRDLQVRNDISSVHSSFVATYIEDWVKSDGRIHPSYNLHGTSSHRISSDNPNLLNLPNPAHGFNVRECYTVPKGCIFVTFDFSSCEVKVLAALCRDEEMLKAILSGLDFHSYTASKIQGIPYDEFVAILEDRANPLAKKYKAFRQAAKAVTFGILYGSSLRGIALGLGITEDAATTLVGLYFQTFPRIKLFVDDCHNMAMWNNFVYSPFGQRKMEYGALPCFKGTAVYNAAMRNAQNVQIQGPASTLGLMAFSEMNSRNKLLNARSLATVYDSIEVESPLRRVAQVIENGFACMDDWPQEQYPWLDFPIGADAEIGFNWGELTHVHRGMTQQDVERALDALNPVKYAECLAAAA